jgi:hypothetical protein
MSEDSVEVEALPSFSRPVRRLRAYVHCVALDRQAVLLDLVVQRWPYAERYRDWRGVRLRFPAIIRAPGALHP